MRIKNSAGVAALVHEKATYTPDDDGFIDVPFELAQTLLNQHHGWEAEAAEVYVPPEEPVTTSGADESEVELTPYQKGLLTRAANEAAKAAKAK